MLDCLHGGVMANLLRLIPAIFLMLLSGWAFAIPSAFQYRVKDPSTNAFRAWVATPDAACGDYLAAVLSNPGNTSGGKTYTVHAVAEGVCTLQRNDGALIYTNIYKSDTVACPANSQATGSTCTCDSGYIESGSQCVKKKSEVCGPLQGMPIGISSMESDFGPQSAQWAAGKLGKSGNACMTGCQTTGTISSCVAGTGKSSSTVCFLSNPSFTGDVCAEPTNGGGGESGTDGGKDKPQDCPVGYEASKYAPGVCIPKPNDCPSGSSPSRYAEGICIPNEKGDDGSCEDPKDPAKRAECEGKGNQCPSGQVQSITQVGTCVPGKDGSGKDKGGNKVECKDGKCTVTKPDGSKEDKGQDEVCKEKPDLAMCKESKGEFSGSCSSNFRCDGDVLQCAALQEQHKRNCTLFDVENDLSRLFSAESKKPQENVLSTNGTEIDLKGHITVDSIIGNGVCPADVPLQVFGKTVVFKLSEFCRYFNAMGMLLFLSTCATCLRILGT